MNLDNASIFYDILIKYSDRNRVNTIVIGAMDGVSHDTIKDYIYHKNWYVAFVEPVTAHIEKCKENFGQPENFYYINKAIYDHNGKQKFVMFKPENVDGQRITIGLAGLTTIYPPRNVMSGCYPSEEYKDDIVTTDFECITVKSLLNQLPFEQVNFVQIDTEGYDWSILKQFDTTNIDFIKIEYYSIPEHEQKELYSMLLEKDFLYVNEHHDTYAIKRKVFNEYTS
jgi:FkbM family methyltransferase